MQVEGFRAVIAKLDTITQQILQCLVQHWDRVASNGIMNYNSVSLLGFKLAILITAGVLV